MKNKLKDDFEDRLIDALVRGAIPSPSETHLVRFVLGADPDNLKRLRKGYPKLVKFLIKNPYYPKSQEDKIRELQFEVNQIKNLMEKKWK